MSSPRVVLSVTSIPRRFHSSLVSVVESLVPVGFDIVVSLPTTYAKWGSHPAPQELAGLKGVVVHSPSQDYGPATKLLGALDYFRTQNSLPDYIITFDDDCVCNDPEVIVNTLVTAAVGAPGAAITFGGIKLDRPPFSSKDGLFHNNIGPVDAVVGWRGVLYPAAPLMANRDIFEMQKELPPGVVHDDDAYFGIALSRMKIPVLAVQWPRTTRDGRPLQMNELESSGGSAVQEAVLKDRRVNESEIFSFAVSQGWLPSPFSSSAKMSALEKAVRRTRLGRKVVHYMRR
jgi:hypothetical protein